MGCCGRVRGNPEMERQEPCFLVRCKKKRCTKNSVRPPFLPRPPRRLQSSTPSATSTPASSVAAVEKQPPPAKKSKMRIGERGGAALRAAPRASNSSRFGSVSPLAAMGVSGGGAPSNLANGGAGVAASGGTPRAAAGTHSTLCVAPSAAGDASQARPFRAPRRAEPRARTTTLPPHRRTPAERTGSVRAPTTPRKPHLYKICKGGIQLTRTRPHLGGSLCRARGKGRRSRENDDAPPHRRTAHRAHWVRARAPPRLEEPTYALFAHLQGRVHPQLVVRLSLLLKQTTIKCTHAACPPPRGTGGTNPPLEAHTPRTHRGGRMPGRASRAASRGKPRTASGLGRLPHHSKVTLSVTLRVTPFYWCTGVARLM